MEREKCRKRGREEDEKEEPVMKNAKKMDEHLDKDKDKHKESSGSYETPFMPVGVFDFPWLKEAVIFKTEDSSEFEQHNFASCSYLDDETSTATAALEFSGHIFYQSPDDDHNKFEEDKDKDKDKHKHKQVSFQVDNLDGAADCIWSFVLDQPLISGFNNI